MSRKRNYETLLFGAGAILGAAAVYYLNTPKGKQLRQTLLEKGNEVATTVTDKAYNMAATVKDKAHEAVQQVSDAIHTTEAQVLQTADELANEATNAVSDFQKGVNRAQEKIKKS